MCSVAGHDVDAAILSTQNDPKVAEKNNTLSHKK
jgi:hypothetical protein